MLIVESLDLHQFRALEVPLRRHSLTRARTSRGHAARVEQDVRVALRTQPAAKAFCLQDSLTA